MLNQAIAKIPNIIKNCNILHMKKVYKWLPKVSKISNHIPISRTFWATGRLKENNLDKIKKQINLKITNNPKTPKRRNERRLSAYEL